MSITPQSPIGIFDSGIGGLTVVKAVRKALPDEHIIYFGDTARVPYGIKSVETVRQYALQITDFLLRKKVKLVLIACNTVSAAAHDDVKARCGKIPALGVIEAGSLAAAEAAGKSVGVIGTLATIGSGAYDRALAGIDRDFRVFSRACPLLVPLAEEGWTDNEIAELTLQTYLGDLREKNLDSLILGCTHYPLFREGIEAILNGSHTKIIDSADSIAAMAGELLEQKKMKNPGNSGNPGSPGKNGAFECYVSDKPQRFQQLAERFLGEKINRIEIVNLI
jgi:glutamate racemase